MTEEYYNELCHAGKVLCEYCECCPDDCERCTVTYLLNDATTEAADAGIIEVMQ